MYCYVRPFKLIEMSYLDTNLYAFVNVLFRTCRGAEDTLAWTENGTYVWISFLFQVIEAITWNFCPIFII